MNHPSNRSERRYAREIWRNYRRKLIYTLWSIPYREIAEDNGAWICCAKQYQAHGNRCYHSMYLRHKRHMEVKRLRKERFEQIMEE